MNFIAIPWTVTFEPVGLSSFLSTLLCIILTNFLTQSKSSKFDNVSLLTEDTVLTTPQFRLTPTKMAAQFWNPYLTVTIKEWPLFPAYLSVTPNMVSTGFEELNIDLFTEEWGKGQETTNQTSH
jgi:hypothetical protein